MQFEHKYKASKHTMCFFLKLRKRISVAYKQIQNFHTLILYVCWLLAFNKKTWAYTKTIPHYYDVALHLYETKTNIQFQLDGWNGLFWHISVCSGFVFNVEVETGVVRFVVFPVLLEFPMSFVLVVPSVELKWQLDDWFQWIQLFSLFKLNWITDFVDGIH